MPGWLGAIRNAVFPSRNGHSHANRNARRNLAQDLFWAVFAHLERQSPGFGQGPRKRQRGLPRRFKRTIHAVDSSTIKLVANNSDWAKHRRREAAAKQIRKYVRYKEEKERKQEEFGFGK